MKKLFSTPIASQNDAEIFIYQMVDLGLAYHPEDRADSIIDRSGQRVFTDAEAKALDDRTGELFAFLDDPCAIFLEMLEHHG